MPPAGSTATKTAAQVAATAWYVAHTKPRSEHVAQEQLQRQDFEVYLPLFRVFKKQTRRGAVKHLPESALREVAHTVARNSSQSSNEQDSVQVVHEPMFPRYLFLRPTRPTQSLSVVRSTLGISRLVMFGQQPATLADAAIDGIRQAETLRETAPLDKISPYAPGMTVQMLDPAFSGMQALVQAVSKDRVTLLLEILGKPQSVQVEFARVAPV